MIFVTAGHVDHGKTSLLQALTGTHTAHLPEEKQRGLTIDLGYAYLPVGERTLGFIDVPGHQKFLSNMLAGLGGVQHALLVVAADEGIKPQTVEHLHILKLLNFEQVWVIISKSDRAEKDQIDDLILKLKQDFPFLVQSRFFITSATKNIGIDELKSALISVSENPQNNEKPFRYCIDRVFHIKGAGLVVTGTAIAGKIKIGDELFLSNGEKVRVKQIHAQNQPAEMGLSGQRLALNLANIEKEKIKRGDFITESNPQFATDRISVILQAEKSLKENQTVHLYHFATHIMGKLNLLNAKQAVRNQQVFAEIILDQPLHITFGDKLILRNADDSQTIAGARVLEIHSPKRYKRSEQRLAYLENLAKTTSYQQRADLYLQDNVMSAKQFLWVEQLFPTQLNLLGFNPEREWLYSAKYQQKIENYLLEKITEYHQKHNDQLGVTKSRLYRIALLNLPQSLAYKFIDNLIETGKLAQTRGWIHTLDHKIELSAEELKIWQQIEPLFKATNQALWVRDIAKELVFDESEMRNLLYKIGKLGYLVPIVKDRFLLNQQIKAFADLIYTMIEKNGAISVNQLRDEIQYGRKLTVQLIEYFDQVGFLHRKGDVHLLRDGDIYQ
ncbi:selenocysteine-specific translation elongation factor [Haemophilus paracuniculus]|uniref:Selenocysteine-specific elongation factor n=1 Tax=Haemophilus paracuniculus TaxID=734 RepID=A0A1T0ARB1_9PAST|nr:selenocysteine-specific translation elongation factor [Haemophilus paracuniculus]OOR98993.1 selenocysteine-specific translation elongation factor [Haemophilus paracuniculus]